MIQMDNMFFGAVILTPYFTFKSASKEHKKAEKVIADSQFFAHNSAAAMMYYIKDNTILSTYKRFYMLGWPFASLNMDDYKAMISGDNSGKTITGGKSQENPAHPLEFISAFSARHFLLSTTKEWFKETYSTEVKFKAIEYEPVNGEKVAFLHFDDLIEGNYSIDGAKESSGDSGKAKQQGKLEDVISWNFTGLYYLSLLIQQVYKGSIANLLSNLKRYNYDYQFTDEQIEAMNRFAQYFTYVKGESNVKPGWVPQMWYSMNRPSKGEFLGFPSETMSIIESGGDVKRSLLLWKNAKGKSLTQEADKLLSTWFKVNKPIKGGKKEDFYAHFKNTVTKLQASAIKAN
jgi:hypothetical protein